METLVDTITLLLIVRVVSYKLPKIIEQEKATSDEFLNYILNSVKRRACYAQIFNFEEAYLKHYLQCLEENSIITFPFSQEFITTIHVLLKDIENTINDFVERIQVTFFNGSSARPNPADSSTLMIDRGTSTNEEGKPSARPNPADSSTLMIDRGTSTNEEGKPLTIYAERYVNFGYLALKFEEKNISAFCLGTFKNIITVKNCHENWKKELKKLITQQNIETIFICKPKKHLYLRINDVNVNFFTLKKKKNICKKCNNINCLAGKVSQYFDFFHSIKFDDCDTM